MTPDIETQNLYLRKLAAEDAPAMYEVLKDREVSGRIGVFSQPFTMEQAVWWCRRAAEFNEAGTGYLCAVFEKSAPERLIGYIGMGWTDETRPRDEWEVGYWLAKDCWHKGYAAEGVRGLIDAKARELGLRRLFVEAAVTNKGSIRVMEKCGFTEVGEFLRNTPDDPARPSVRYEMFVK